MMVQEAKGTNGRILGSLNYFSLINEKFPQKSLLKDRTKANYFLWLGNSISKVKKILEGIDGKKIQAFFQFAVNSICSDIKKSVAKGEFADFEHRENLRNALKQLEKCGYKVPSTIYDEIKKLRRLEDFHKKMINLDFRGAQYPVEVWLEWKNGKNILHIHVKVYFDGSEKDGIYVDEKKEYSRKQLVLQGFEKWTGNYKVFNSAEEGKQDLQVICTAEEVNSDTITALPVYLEHVSHENESHTHTADWSQQHPAVQMELDYYYKDIFISPESYIDTAKHEFGHVLGIRDAYTIKNDGGKYEYHKKYLDIKEDIEELELPTMRNGTNMVMNNNGPIINNDIEMLILAWQTGKQQYFHLDDGGEEISEALGR